MKSASTFFTGLLWIKNKEDCESYERRIKSRIYQVFFFKYENTIKEIIAAYSYILKAIVLCFNSVL